jgi:hypothetical protein
VAGGCLCRRAHMGRARRLSLASAAEARAPNGLQVQLLGRAPGRAAASGRPAQEAVQPEELGLIGDGAARAGGGRARRAADDDDRGGELSGLSGGHIRAGPHGPHARPGAAPGCGRLSRGGARLDATTWQAQHAAGSAMAAARGQPGPAALGRQAARCARTAAACSAGRGEVSAGRAPSRAAGRCR